MFTYVLIILWALQQYIVNCLICAWWPQKYWLRMFCCYGFFYGPKKFIEVVPSLVNSSEAGFTDYQFSYLGVKI